MRDIDDLHAAGPVVQQPGGRIDGAHEDADPLKPTTAYTRAAAAAQAVRCQLADWLTDWDDHDLAAFGQLVSRFNQSTSKA